MTKTRLKNLTVALLAVLAMCTTAIALSVTTRARAEDEAIAFKESTPIAATAVGAEKDLANNQLYEIGVGIRMKPTAVLFDGSYSFAAFKMLNNDIGFSKGSLGYGDEAKITKAYEPLILNVCDNVALNGMTLGQIYDLCFLYEETAGAKYDQCAFHGIGLDVLHDATLGSWLQFKIQTRYKTVRDLLGFDPATQTLSKPLTVTFMPGFSSMPDAEGDKVTLQNAINLQGNMGTALSVTPVTPEVSLANVIAKITTGAADLHNVAADRLVMDLSFSSSARMFDNIYTRANVRMDANHAWYASIPATESVKVASGKGNVTLTDNMTEEGDKDGTKAGTTQYMWEKLAKVLGEYVYINDVKLRTFMDNNTTGTAENEVRFEAYNQNDLRINLSLTDEKLTAALGYDTNAKTFKKNIKITFKSGYTAMDGTGLAKDIDVVYFTDGSVAEVTGYELTAPTKTEYLVGDELDVSGGAVNAVLKSGAKKKVADLTAAMCAGFDSSAAGAKTVTVTYDGAAVGTYSVNVAAAVRELKEIVVTPPTKRTYRPGEDLYLTGMVVTAKYNDDAGDEVIAAGRYTVNATKAQDTEGSQTVTVTFGEKTATFTITVQYDAMAATGVNGWYPNADVGMHLIFDTQFDASAAQDQNLAISSNKNIFDYILFNNVSISDIYANATDMYGNKVLGQGNRGAAFVAYKIDADSLGDGKTCLEIWINGEVSAATAVGGVRSGDNYLTVKEGLIVGDAKIAKTVTYKHSAGGGASWEKQADGFKVPAATDVPSVDDLPFAVTMNMWHHDTANKKIGFQISFTRIIRPSDVTATDNLIETSWVADHISFNGKKLSELYAYAKENITGTTLAVYLEKTNTFTVWIDERIPEAEGGLKKEASGAVKADGNVVIIFKDMPIPGGVEFASEEDVKYTYKNAIWGRDYDDSKIVWTPFTVSNVGAPEWTDGGVNLRYNITFDKNVVTKKYVHVNAGAEWLINTGASGLSREEIEKLSGYGIMDSILDCIKIEVNGAAKTVRQWMDSDEVLANRTALVMMIHFGQLDGNNNMQIVWSSVRFADEAGGNKVDQPLCPETTSPMKITFLKGLRTPGYFELQEDVTFAYSGTGNFVKEVPDVVYDTITFENVLFNGTEIAAGGSIALAAGTFEMTADLFTVEFAEGEGIRYTVSGNTGMQVGDNTVTITATSGDVTETFTFTAVCSNAGGNESVGGCKSAGMAASGGAAAVILLAVGAALMIKRRKAA